MIPIECICGCGLALTVKDINPFTKVVKCMRCGEQIIVQRETPFPKIQKTAIEKQKENKETKGLPPWLKGEKKK